MTQQTIYIGGSETVTVPATESIAVSNFGGGVAKIYYWIVAANVPDDWQYQQSIENEEVVLGPFSVAQLVRIDAGTSKVLFDIGASPATGTPASTLGGLTAAQFVRSDASDDLTGTDYNLNNQTFINGRDTGATERDLIGVDGSDIAQVGSSALPTNINSDGTLTHNGSAVIDSDDLPLPDSGNASQNIQVNASGTALEYVGPLISLKNKIINGDHKISDRGTSFAGITADDIFTLDRWRSIASGATLTITQEAFTPGQTDVPGEPAYFLRCEATIADDNWGVAQSIEDVRTFAGQNANYSLYIRANASMNVAYNLSQNFGSGGSASVDHTQTATIGTDWQLLSNAFSLTSISGKTIGTDHFLDAIFICTDNTTGYFDIALVQVESGSNMTSFDLRPERFERSLCYPFATIFQPGQLNGFGLTVAANLIRLKIPIPLPMRSTPTLSSAAAIDIRFGGATYAVSLSTNVTSVSDSFNCITIDTDVTGGGASTGGYTIANDSGGVVIFNAELF